MGEHNFNVAERLGSFIKLNRLKIGMTQYQLAENICSQSMISSIERGIDVPNVVLFTQICQRLNIRTTDQFLTQSLNINSFLEFSDTLFELCKKHQYKDMLTLMNKSDILEKLVSDQDIQIYYYYYSCALYHLKIDTTDAIRYLKLAANVTMAQPYNPKSEIEMLLINTLASFYLEIGNFEKSSILFKSVYKQFMKGTVMSENLNVILYHYGDYLYATKNYTQALKVFLNGFDAVIMKQSYFMLAEYALSISQCYEKLGDHLKSEHYHNKHVVFFDILTRNT